MKAPAGSDSYFAHFSEGFNTILLLVCLFVLVSPPAEAQEADRLVQDRCGTMTRLEAKFQRSPELRIKFEAQKTQFNSALREGRYKLSAATSNIEGSSRTVSTIPIVFHIVLNNPDNVTDAQVYAQLDVLNRNFLGANADSTSIPAYFKSLFGKSAIQFCLAQRTPAGEETSGIERVKTTQASFTTNDVIKHASGGGADAWDDSRYFNVWICTMSNNVLGYATFPGEEPANEQGVVIDYRSLPGGSFAAYNTGKTLVHESGHYFNLYHIWGDDDGGCTGTDFVDDTPNQSGSTNVCPAGIKTDNCTTGGNGIMYQNYMDYTTDACLIMFTTQQVARMESALLAYRPSLLSSDGCQAPVQRNYDAQLVSINQPAQRLCASTFAPVITIKNKGQLTLTSLVISVSIDNGPAITQTWTGTLAKSASLGVTLNSLTTPTGNHTLAIRLTQPNGNTDEDPGTDALSVAYQYYTPVTAVSEGFERDVFPPAGWDIVNPDQGVTWERGTTAAKTGTMSAVIKNFNNPVVGQKDDLRLPTATFAGIDSAFLSFQVAAAAFTVSTATNNVWDTLEVLISTDCGQTYTSLYKKYGSSLITRTTPVTSAFTPTASEWRKDSVNLGDYIGKANVVLAFRNTNGFENNIYLDDVSLRTVTVNPNLKSRGFLVTPNPTNGNIAVEFYPQPVNLKGIQVYNLMGQKVREILINGGAANRYNMDISSYASGTYIVRAVFADRVIVRKVVKL